MVYDVIFLGSGPANLFAAMELVQRSDLKVLVLEKARRLNDSRNISLGWFGGCARAQANLFIDPGFGGEITDQGTLDMFLERLKVYTNANLKTSKPKLLKKTLKRLGAAGIVVEQPTTIQLTEDKMIKLGDYFYQCLRLNGTVLHKIEVESIRKVGQTFHLQTNNGAYKAKHCVLGLGRGGTNWLDNIDHNLNLPYTESGFELGVRLEFPGKLLEECFSKTNFFRFKFGDYKTTVPTYHGSVETEETGDYRISNGRTINSHRSHFANLGVVKSFQSKNPQQNLNRLIEIVNVLCDGQLLKEPLSKLLNGKSVISPVAEFDSLKEGLGKLVGVFPQLGKRCAVYAPEAKLGVVKYELSPGWESETKGLYIIGDLSGRTKSFVQAACSGLQAAEDILKE